MDPTLDQSIALLARTPAALDALLRDLPSAWALENEGPGTWSAFDVIGHLNHCERADWMPRARMILAHGESRALRAARPSRPAARQCREGAPPATRRVHPTPLGQPPRPPRTLAHPAATRPPRYPSRLRPRHPLPTPRHLGRARPHPPPPDLPRPRPPVPSRRRPLERLPRRPPMHRPQRLNRLLPPAPTLRATGTSTTSTSPSRAYAAVVVSGRASALSASARRFDGGSVSLVQRG